MPAKRDGRDFRLRLVQDAFARLHDLPLMAHHPLVDALGLTRIDGTRQLQRSLLRALDQLRPPSSQPRYATRWRQYHYLRLRYLEGASLDEVQSFIGVGDRQARRDHRDGLEAVEQLLFVGPSSSGGTPVVRDADNLAAELDDEIDRVGSQAPPESTDLPRALREALRLTSQLAAKHSVTVRQVDSLPDAVSVIAYVSPTVLRQLLLALLSYLIQYGPGDLQLALTTTPDTVTLRGSIDPCGQSRPGLGAAAVLTTAQRLSESQGGFLRMVTDPSGGTVVELTLPASRPTVVLVVDDNPDVSLLFRRYVQGTGYQIVQARNGPVAFDLARSLRPNVILLDLMMPLQDGWDLLGQLQADSVTTEIPVIACSVLPERDLAISLGVSDFLAKPVRRESLLAALAPYHERGAHPGSP